MSPAESHPLLVVIVAYRADRHLAQCLDVLGRSISVIVVDNDASEGTRAVAETAGARYVDAASNIGFSAAVNLALRTAWDGDRDVLLLNPDARISGSDALVLRDGLYRSGDRCAAVSPRLVDEVGAVQQVEWPFPSPSYAWLEACGASRFFRGRQFVIGAVLMLSGAALNEVGWLDERYFLYAEETDWQRRALLAGWSVRLIPDIVALHVGAASSSDPLLRERLFHSSKEIYGRRWYGTRGWTVMRLACLLAAARRSLIGRPAERQQARRTLWLYVRGPVRAAQSAVGGAPR